MPIYAKNINAKFHPEEWTKVRVRGLT